jgi:hypothetical protein
VYTSTVPYVRLVSILIAISLLMPPFSWAQTPPSGSLRLVTSPLPISLATEPGKSVKTELKIRNGGTQTENLKVGLLKFDAYGDSGSPKLLDRGPGDDFFDWVSFSETRFAIQPNQWKTIAMTINVPKSAAFGYYYAATFSRVDPTTPTSGQPETALVGSTATLVV